MESNHTTTEQEAIKAAEEFARGVRPLVGNINKIFNVLKTNLTPEQQAELEKQGLNKELNDATKSISELEKKLNNLRF